MSANLLFPQMKFQVQEQIYDSQSMRDEVNFYHQRQGAPSELTKKLTYIIGKYKNNYPLSLATVGGIGYANQQTAIELDDIQYTYPVMGRKDKASVVYSTEYVNGDKPGIGHSKFYITFSDNWIKRYYIIESEHGVQAYVHGDGEPTGNGGFRYEVQLDPAGPGDFCPLSELNPGIRWIDLNTAVAESESRSTESKMVMPGTFKNQMGFHRAGMQWAGNAAEKVMKINIEWEGKTTNVWMDYFMWQFEERWLTECEHAYWYSRYNRMVDGTIPLKDLYTGKVIPRGSGVLEQITNKATYSSLTYNTLTNKIGDALFGQNDTAGMDITLYTGTGGRREFHKAIIAAGGQYVVNPMTSVAGLGAIADKFVTGSGYNLMLGGYFDGFYHIDGYTIRLKYNPVFDTGRVAMKSPLHPVTGLPLESYRMVFIDNSEQDGQPNIRHVAQKGRAFIDGVVKGLTKMPRSVNILLGNSGNEGDKFLSTVQDKSEYTRMKSAGIQIMRANRCFDLQCTMGQSSSYPYLNI
jgi:hypothetical protein